MAQMLGNILEYSMHRAYGYENSFMVKCLVIRQLLILPMVPPTSATPRRCRKVTSDTEISKSQIVTDSTIIYHLSIRLWLLEELTLHHLKEKCWSRSIVSRKTSTTSPFPRQSPIQLHTQSCHEFLLRNDSQSMYVGSKSPKSYEPSPKRKLSRSIQAEFKIMFQTFRWSWAMLLTTKSSFGQWLVVEAPPDKHESI